jgi:hypothetical protein
MFVGRITMSSNNPTVLADVQRERQAQILEEGLRESIRRDAALRRGSENESEGVAGNLGAILQRVGGTSLMEIDRAVSELNSIRDVLETEGRRVQNEIVKYAHLSQASMQSTKTIAESVAQWKSVASR